MEDSSINEYIDESGGVRRKLAQNALKNHDEINIVRYGQVHKVHKDPEKGDMLHVKSKGYDKLHHKNPGYNGKNFDYNPNKYDVDYYNKLSKDKVKEKYYSKGTDKISEKEPNRILKMQQDKNRQLKEAAEYILSVLDEMDYLDN